MKQEVYIETSEQTSIKREEEEKKAIHFFLFEVHDKKTNLHDKLSGLCNTGCSNL